MVKGDVAQLRMHIVLIRLQFARIGQFYIFPCLQKSRAAQILIRRSNISHPRNIRFQHERIQPVVRIVRESFQIHISTREDAYPGQARSIVSVGVALVRPQIHESHNIAKVLRRTAFVRHPNLNFSDLYRRSDERQVFEIFFIVFAEELAQEIVAVRLVLIPLDVELGRGSPTLHIDALALRTLLGEHGGDHGVSKLELALQTK